ncbi:hypothetical protein TNIN_295321 [Trichonephila inaurata madagascariensis]|uniref:Uncharacterized protein n=1 Tax=Trichonephila inaurata madagascariensis TaxID=2747483 RepID=A0A8X6YMJ8_9ARAC|nr:hypothetical protein TNIN_295321 [Trichonephila inaurata madagascariensis]
MGPRRTVRLDLVDESWTRPSIVLDRRRDWTERPGPRRASRPSDFDAWECEVRTEDDGPDEAGRTEEGRSGGRAEGPRRIERVGIDRRVDLVDGSWTRPSIVLDRRKIGPRGVGPRWAEVDQRVAGPPVGRRTSKFQSRALSTPSTRGNFSSRNSRGLPSSGPCRSSADQGPLPGARSGTVVPKVTFLEGLRRDLSEYVKISRMAPFVRELRAPVSVSRSEPPV